MHLYLHFSLSDKKIQAVFYVRASKPSLARRTYSSYRPLDATRCGCSASWCIVNTFF